MKKATLLINLGSPNSTDVSDVKAYLKQFLMDKYVLDISWPIRWAVVNGTILPKRPAATAEAYKQIWTKEGSPLIALSKQLLKAVQKTTSTPTYLAMRYGNPSIQHIISTIKNEQQDLQELTILPLYPHYAESSTLTAIVEAKKWLKNELPHIKLNTIESFYNHPGYINNLVETIKPITDKPYDTLLFSYHGLPERHIKKCDPSKSHCLQTPNCCAKKSVASPHCYKHHCLETTRLVSEKLNLDTSKTIISFQSRLGRDPWITPNTEDIIINEAKKGTQHIAIVCPSFVTDCLETLEEINMRARDLFIKNGGKTVTYIPCLNTQKSWITTIHELIQKG